MSGQTAHGVRKGIIMAERKIEVSNPRYTVREVEPGFEIIDTQGKDESYLIDRFNTDGIDISESSKRVANHWAYIWNIVEMGYCGACQKKFAEGESRHAAIGFHSLDKIVCYACAASPED